MALISMTGFGRARGEISSRFGVSVVIRSVNHRYLDIQFKLPDDLRPKEQALRQRRGQGLVNE